MEEDPRDEHITSIKVRFETDQARQKALELDGMQAGESVCLPILICVCYSTLHSNYKMQQYFCVVKSNFSETPNK